MPEQTENEHLIESVLFFKDQKIKIFLSKESLENLRLVIKNNKFLDNEIWVMPNKNGTFSYSPEVREQ